MSLILAVFSQHQINRKLFLLVCIINGHCWIVSQHLGFCRLKRLRRLTFYVWKSFLDHWPLSYEYLSSCLQSATSRSNSFSPLLPSRSNKAAEANDLELLYITIICILSPCYHYHHRIDQFAISWSYYQWLHLFSFAHRSMIFSPNFWHAVWLWQSIALCLTPGKATL